MAEDVTIGGGGAVFVGEDKSYELECFAMKDGVAPNLARRAMDAYRSGDGVPSDFDTYWEPVDMAGWDVVFDVKTTDAASASILTKSATITGTYSATRASNTQRAVATHTDEELSAAAFSVQYKTLRHSWKRTSAGVETILAYGNFGPQRATQA